MASATALPYSVLLHIKF